MKNIEQISFDLKLSSDSVDFIRNSIPVPDSVLLKGEYGKAEDSQKEELSIDSLIFEYTNLNSEGKRDVATRIFEWIRRNSVLITGRMGYTKSEITFDVKLTLDRGTLTLFNVFIYDVDVDDFDTISHMIIELKWDKFIWEAVE